MYNSNTNLQNNFLEIEIVHNKQQNGENLNDIANNIKLSAIKLLNFHVKHQSISQTIIAEGGKRRLLNKDSAKANISVKILGVSLQFLNKLRCLAFSGEKRLYNIKLEDGSKIFGKFIITSFKIASETSEIPEIILEIKSSSRLNYSQE
jgi:hypothetical protein